jgi:hypothetical protein
MNDDQPSPVEHTPMAARVDLSTLAITLLKGVIYRDGEQRLWESLLNLQPRVRDFVAILNLDLVVDEGEGYAFLRSKPDISGEQADTALPRLIARRPLSFPVSLLLALLRKKLAELDAGGADTRLVLTRDEIVELVRVFLPDTSNEAKLIDQIEAHINKIVDLGFLRRLKPAAGSAPGPVHYEVRRILKAFVDAQWLAEVDARLASYRAQLAGGGAQDDSDE